MTYEKDGRLYSDPIDFDFLLNGEEHEVHQDFWGGYNYAGFRYRLEREVCRRRLRIPMITTIKKRPGWARISYPWDNPA